ncbi:chaperonin 10-like protein [Neurospora hispaniola]|uniref:Chaperonin 10-like protein n=1 Tax=Neurospora hispaniola TaxID=588809 RepID=A0AAJ0I2I0_9PEZI|nr:chaperonin 10-like protein [Neurospora hispaniola]
MRIEARTRVIKSRDPAGPNTEALSPSVSSDPPYSSILTPKLASRIPRCRSPFQSRQNGEHTPPVRDTQSHSAAGDKEAPGRWSYILRQHCVVIGELSNCAATTVRSVKSLIPLLDRVLVQRVKAEAKTASGIFLPESSVKDLNEAKVLAVGPGALDKDGKRLPMGVNAGDRVLIPQYGGSPVKVGEEEYTLFRDSE